MSRVVLRAWRDADLAPFAALNADPRVMEHVPAPLAREESDALAARIRTHLHERGFGLWALEIPGVADFAGFVGLQVPSWRPEEVEIAWRLAFEHWGRGYATEAARRVLDMRLFRDVVSFTVPANVRSIRVMEKIGLRFAGEFEHPKVDVDRLRRHVLYRT